MIINNEEQHRHGGIARFDLNRFNLPERSILDFSVNLNPLGPPRIIGEQWKDMVDAITDYPTVEGEGVAVYYQRKFGISPNNFLAGNGSTEMIYLVPRVLGLGRVLVITPSYNDYSRASTLAGAEVATYNLSPGNSSFLFEKDQIFTAMEDADALWLGNPNNPTGTLFPRELILEVAEKFPEKWVIIDEAFIQFVEEREKISFITPQPRQNILAIHSLTKFYALAGIRIGGVIGSEDVISRLRKAKEPWSVNGIAERIAPLLLECGDYEERSCSLVKAEQQRLVKILDSIEGIKPYTSAANFILCQWQRTDDLDDLLRHLLANGLYVRDCRNFKGFQNNFFRLGLGLPEENDQLIGHISSFSGAIGRTERSGASFRVNG